MTLAYARAEPGELGVQRSARRARFGAEAIVTDVVVSAPRAALVQAAGVDGEERSASTRSEGGALGTVGNDVVGRVDRDAGLADDGFEPRARRTRGSLARASGRRWRGRRRRGRGRARRGVGDSGQVPERLAVPDLRALVSPVTVGRPGGREGWSRRRWRQRGSRVLLELAAGPRGARAEDAVRASNIEAELIEAVLQLSDVVAAEFGAGRYRVR